MATGAGGRSCADGASSEGNGAAGAWARADGASSNGGPGVLSRADGVARVPAWPLACCWLPCVAALPSTLACGVVGLYAGSALARPPTRGLMRPCLRPPRTLASGRSSQTRRRLLPCAWLPGQASATAWPSHNAMKAHLNDHCVGTLSGDIPQAYRCRPAARAKPAPPTSPSCGMCPNLLGLPGLSAWPVLWPELLPPTRWPPGPNYLCCPRQCWSRPLEAVPNGGSKPPNTPCDAVSAGWAGSEPPSGTSLPLLVGGGSSSPGPTKPAV